MTVIKRVRSGVHHPDEDFTTDGHNGFPVAPLSASRAATAAKATAARRGSTVTSPTMARQDPRGPASPALRSGDTDRRSLGQMDAPDDGRELPDYFGFLRRQALVIVLAILVVTAAAVALLTQTPSVYTSHATVLVQPLASGAAGVVGGRTDGAINLDTEAQILKSTSVAQAAKKALNSTASTSALLNRLSVAIPANSSVMTIAYQAHSPAKAAAGAQAFAQAYLANRAATANADVKQQVNSYIKQRTSLQAELLAVTKRLQIELPSSSAGIYDRSQKELVADEIQDLNSNLNTLQGQVVIPGQIIAPAGIPSQPSGPKSQLYIVGGIVLGLIVGLLLGLARDSRRRRRVTA
jgi:uncharacterized protein involved in exopolysaccharide biosynthesis